MEFPGEGARSMILALQNGQVVGTVTYKLEGPTLEFSRLFVVPSARRQRIAETLVIRCAHFARQAHCHTITCLCVRDNHDALAFYEHCGFSPINWYDETRVLLGKILP